MNNKFTVHDLAIRVSERTGIDVKTVEELIKERFREVENSLLATKKGCLEDIGSFELDEFREIHFKADSKISEIVNAPFAMFSPEILNDQMIDSDIVNTAELDVETENETINQETTSTLPDALGEKPVTVVNHAKGQSGECEQEDDKRISNDAICGNQPKPILEIPLHVPIAPQTQNENRVADETLSESIEPKSITPSWLMFVVGCIVGLALGIIVTFILMTEFGHTQSIDSELTDCEISE